MRDTFNRIAPASAGEFLMKCDAHCRFGPGWDEALKAHCDGDWVAVPTRHSLNGDTWTVCGRAGATIVCEACLAEGASKPNDGCADCAESMRLAGINYHYLTFPYARSMYGYGLHGKEFPRRLNRQMNFETTHTPVDDLMSFQGSCWFTPKANFLRLGPLDQANYNFYAESIEVGMRQWMSRRPRRDQQKDVVRALSQGQQRPAHARRAHGPRLLSLAEGKRESEAFATDYWMNDRMPGARADVRLVHRSLLVAARARADRRALAGRLERRETPNRFPQPAGRPDPGASVIPMPDALTYICTKYGLNRHERRQPIEIRNTNRETLARLTYPARPHARRGWKAYRGYRDHVNQQKLDDSSTQTQERLAAVCRARDIRAAVQRRRVADVRERPRWISSTSTRTTICRTSSRTSPSWSPKLKAGRHPGRVTTTARTNGRTRSTSSRRARVGGRVRHSRRGLSSGRKQKVAGRAARRRAIVVLGASAARRSSGTARGRCSSERVVDPHTAGVARMARGLITELAARAPDVSSLRIACHRDGQHATGLRM
jgi:hypothetical protein